MLPKRVTESLARSARPGRTNEAVKAAEQVLRAREEGRPADGRRAAIKAKQAAPRSAWVREQLGLFAFDLGEWHEAVQELLAYRRLGGDQRYDPTIAECYRREGKPARALEVIGELKRSMVPPRVWIDGQIVRARALADTGRMDTAITLLKAAAKGASSSSIMLLRDALNDLKAET